MAKKRFGTGGITISLGGDKSSDGVFGEKANSGNQYPFPNGNAGNSPTETTQDSEGMQASAPAPQPQMQGNNQGDNQNVSKMFKRGGAVKAKAPKASSASKRGDGIAQRGKTRGVFVACGGGRVR